MTNRHEDFVREGGESCNRHASTGLTAGLLLVVLFAAAAFRFYGLNWDQLIGAHPDERYIIDAAVRLSFANSLNPFDGAPNLAYGHLPLYLLALARAVLPSIDPFLVGRAISATFDLGTVGLTFLLGRRMYSARIGLFAAALVASVPAHVQQAHFFTPDTILVFLVLGALLFATRFVQGEREADLWLAGIAAGLAVGTKATAAILVVPLVWACLSSSLDRRGALARCGSVALLSFFVSSPYALIDLPRFLGNLADQSAILGGGLDVPYTLQYQGTMPYLYPVIQQLRWGMGWLAGLCALGGLLAAVVRAVKKPPRPGEWLLLAWTIPFFAFVGGLYVKFPRYVLALLPFLAIYAALLLDSVTHRRRALGLFVSLTLVGVLLLRCFALATMYAAPHPWVAASEWFGDQVETGSTIAVEAWDHPLPLDAEGYEILKLPVFREETTQKQDAIDRALTRADYVVLASRRGYATLSRLPGRYPRTSSMYERLFAGDLGFEPTTCFGRHPRLGALALVDDPTAGLPFSLPDLCRPSSGPVVTLGRLDESFVVYDHPTVIVFEASQ